MIHFGRRLNENSLVKWWLNKSLYRGTVQFSFKWIMLPASKGKEMTAKFHKNITVLESQGRPLGPSYLLLIPLSYILILLPLFPTQEGFVLFKLELVCCISWRAEYLGLKWDPSPLWKHFSMNLWYQPLPMFLTALSFLSKHLQG